MKYVVIDTNCLLRMIPIRSPFRQVWEAFLSGEYCMCVSNEIIDEYMEILSQKVNMQFAENIVRAILASPYCLRFAPHFHFRLIQQDLDDNKFVDCAIIANADYIVSDDSHFRVLASIPYPHVQVVSLDQFSKDI